MKEYCAVFTVNVKAKNVESAEKKALMVFRKKYRECNGVVMTSIDDVNDI